MKKFANYCIIIAIAGVLTGCKFHEEKSYEHYTLHPEELYHDYKYCETHPSAGVCLNIIKKYFKYQRHVKIGSSSAITPQSGSIFRNLDQPINSLGMN